MEILKQSSDAIIAFSFLKRLMTSTVDSQAYKLGLIDSSGKLVKYPKSKEENDALGILDQLCIKLRRMLGSKISEFNKFLYIENLPNNYINNLNLSTPNQGKAEIKRMKNDLSKLMESILNETPHVEIEDDKFIDFHAEINKKWILDFCKYYRQHKVKKKEIDLRLLKNAFFKIALKNDIKYLNDDERRIVDLTLPKTYFK